MRCCPNCGTQLNDSAMFCEGCGTPVSRQAEPAVNPGTMRRSRGRKLHCPECAGERLVPVVESTNSGGVALTGQMTRRVGVTTYSSNTTHRNYWMCQDCGNKFRNLQNLKEEIVTDTKQMKAMMIFCIVFGVISLLMLQGVSLGDGLVMLVAVPMLIIVLVLDIVFWIIWLSVRNRIAKMVEEKRYLEARCFSRM